MNPGDILLTRAVTDGDTTAVRALLAAGSDVNTTSGGQTPLILAIAFRRIQILKLLLEAGADPHLRDSLGLNAIDWAERRGFAEGVKLFAESQTGKREIPTDASRTNPTILDKSAPRQMDEQNLPIPRESTQEVHSDEKSRRWIAGLKQRIDEIESRKVEEVQRLPSPRIEIQNGPEEAPPRVDVNDNPPPASITLPKSEVIASTPDRATNIAPDTPGTKDQTYSPAATTPVVPQNVLARSQPPWSTIAQPASSSRKRCPKCNALYNSELLTYCAKDMTPLVNVSEPMDASPTETRSMPPVWFLMVLTFVVACGVTYLIISNLKSEQSAPVSTSSAQGSSDNGLPLVAGALSGKQVNVPKPEYPVSAKSEHVSGTVTVRVTVNKKGRVTGVKVIEGDSRLRNGAISAAHKATFSPEKLMGRGAVGTIVYTFKE
ncbi:MAG: TonB family protein [Pyrinomonadaceae bacterium]